MDSFIERGEYFVVVVMEGDVSKDGIVERKEIFIIFFYCWRLVRERERERWKWRVERIMMWMVFCVEIGKCELILMDVIFYVIF